MHIVEELIAERAPRLISRPRLFKYVKPVLYRMLAYDDAVRLADRVEPLTGREAPSLRSQIKLPLASKQLTYPTYPKREDALLLPIIRRALQMGLPSLKLFRNAALTIYIWRMQTLYALSQKPVTSSFLLNG